MADATTVDATAVDTIAAAGAVLLLAAVTAATRVGGVWMMSYVRITPRIEAFLKYMSVSVLISIVAPATWFAGPHIWIGVAAAALVAVATRSALGAMFAGTALAALARGFGL
jgi:uncharacterized membrane protein